METRRRKEWFDDESFWRDTYPFMFPEERMNLGALEVELALALAGPRGKAALDLCCGPGRCAVPLAKRGFRVTGVDRTPFLLNKARARARREKVKVEWVLSDMRDFVRPGAYDLALSMYTSFGYFADPAEDRTVLANMQASLKPGGVFLIDVAGKERLARIFLETTSCELSNGSKLIERHQVCPDWTRLRNEWIIIRDGLSKSYQFEHAVYSGLELRDRMTQAGFAEVKLYGDFKGSDYGLNAQRLIAVGRKLG